MLNFNIANIGGIRDGQVAIDTGLNVIQASNFQGKSSVITAIQTVMGATGHYDPHPLTEGADSGSVSLETPQKTHSVSLEQTSTQAVSRSGTPYISDRDDQRAARLFAFLGENNPIRQAVRNGEDLTEFLQEPLDIAAIDREIGSLRTERRELRSDISDAQEAAERLPGLQADVTQLETELDDLRERQDEVEADSDSKAEADELSDRLSEKQSDLKSITREIDRLESQLETKTATLDDKRDEITTLTIPEVPDHSNIDVKKDRIDSLTGQISLFNELYRANKNILESADLTNLTTIDRGIKNDAVGCWTCGSRVQISDIESQIEQLNDRVSELKSERRDLQQEIEDVESQRDAAQQKRRERDSLESRIGELRQQIDAHEGDLNHARERKKELEVEIEQLQAKLEDAETEYNEELTDLKAEIRNLSGQLERKREELATLETEKSDLESLQKQETELTEEIESLQKQKVETQRQLCNEFEAAVTDIIERFDPGFEYARFDTITNRQTGEIEEFELYIARDGRETSVDTLSEGEIELIGVAVALAGYRVYDIADIVPCILVDGISQLAAEHLHGLIKYVEDTAEILVTTAYPEAGDFDGTMVSPTSWSLVSEEEGTPV